MHMSSCHQQTTRLVHFQNHLYSAPIISFKLFVTHIAVSRGDAFSRPNGFNTMASSSTRCCDNNCAESSRSPSKASALCWWDLTSRALAEIRCSLLLTLPPCEIDMTSASNLCWGRSSRNEVKSKFPSWWWIPLASTLGVPLIPDVSDSSVKCSDADPVPTRNVLCRMTWITSELNTVRSSGSCGIFFSWTCMTSNLVAC